MRNSRLIVRVAIGCTLLSLALSESQADDFVLTTGARVRGEWLNRDDDASSYYLVAPEHGGRVKLERSRVAKVLQRSATQTKYDRLGPTVADEADDQWKLARWCRDNKLPEQCEQHLLRAIELDPEHELARRALGYSEVGGQWVKKAEHLERNGYVRYKGRWRLSQEIELAEQRHALELAKKDWYVKLSRWRSQLNKENRHAAMENIRRVRDPLAIEAVGRLLEVERDRRMRVIYVEVLGQIAGDEASVALVDLALSDRDEEVYYACLDQLAARETPPLVRQFVSALKSQQNDHVNRAAIALSSLGDQSAVPPLIDALVTRHFTVSPGSDMTSNTFVRGGPGVQSGDSFTTGASPTRVFVQMVPNHEVLKTLVKLTGVSFSFDQQAWRNWYTLQQRRGSATAVDARRIE